MSEVVIQEREIRAMPYARCSECGQTILVEKVNNDVMMWHGTHCGASQAYFASKEIFPMADDFEKKKPAVVPAPAGPRLGLAGLKAAAQARRARLVAAK
jgi:ribosomal protein L37AE/L43A